MKTMKLLRATVCRLEAIIAASGRRNGEVLLPTYIPNTSRFKRKPMPSRRHPTAMSTAEHFVALLQRNESPEASVRHLRHHFRCRFQHIPDRRDLRPCLLDELERRRHIKSAVTKVPDHDRSRSRHSRHTDDKHPMPLFHMTSNEVHRLRYVFRLPRITISIEKPERLDARDLSCRSTIAKVYKCLESKRSKRDTVLYVSGGTEPQLIEDAVHGQSSAQTIT